jgi:hypothetical protein
MSTDEGAQKAVSELNEFQLGGRMLTVNEARPKVASVADSAAAIPVVVDRNHAGRMWQLEAGFRS